MESAVSTRALSTARLSRWRLDRMFYTALPIAMAMVVLVGFAPTYYLKTAYGTPALAPLYHLHGFLFTCWMLLMIMQPALIAVRRTDVHRQIGVAGGLLATAMLAAAFFVTIDLGKRGVAPPGIPPIAFLIIPFATIVVFPALVAAALVWRRTPEIHKRLMLIATLELVPAGFGRWPVVSTMGPLAFFGLTDLFVLAMLVYDRATRGRFHAATLGGGLFLVGSQVLRVMLGDTAAWQSFARWLIR